METFPIYAIFQPELTIGDHFIEVWVLIEVTSMNIHASLLTEIHTQWACKILFTFQSFCCHPLIVLTSWRYLIYTTRELLLLYSIWEWRLLIFNMIAYHLLSTSWSVHLEKHQMHTSMDISTAIVQFIQLYNFPTPSDIILMGHGIKAGTHSHWEIICKIPNLAKVMTLGTTWPVALRLGTLTVASLRIMWFHNR